MHCYSCFLRGSWRSNWEIRGKLAAGGGMRLVLAGSGARLAFLEHDRDPMAWEQLFGSLEGFGLISSKERCHGDAFGQVSDHVE